MRFRNTTVSNGSAATSEDVLYTNLLFVHRPLASQMLENTLKGKGIQHKDL